MVSVLSGIGASSFIQDIFLLHNNADWGNKGTSPRLQRSLYFQGARAPTMPEVEVP